MKCIIITLLAFFTFLFLARSQDFNSMLDSGKTEFIKEFEEQDFTKAAYYLEKAVELNPNDAESRYYLAYAYSKMNSKDGKSMIDVDVELVLKSSEQLEKVNKLCPHYNKEIIVLDPYSKLTSEWGSLAMSYWHKNKIDSAKWAFAEGKKRGGFDDFVLSFNRKLLDACTQSAYLISSGDNFTIPLWYLQIVENYRKDVSVIDISLLNTKWYPHYLLKNKIASFDVTSQSLDSIEHGLWMDSLITINNFTWTVGPSFENKYLLRGDKLFLSLLNENQFKREIYFTIGFNENNRLSLTNYISSLIVVEKLTIESTNNNSEEDNLKTVRNILEISSLINKNSNDELEILDMIRYYIFYKIESYITLDDTTSAKKMIDLIDKFANEMEFPFLTENMKNYANYLRSLMKK